MIRFRTPLMMLALWGALGLGSLEARAQAAHDTSLLTEAERAHYRALLSKSYDSAERSKVKSEMNRLIQTRRLELHKKKKAPKAPKPY